MRSNPPVDFCVHDSSYVVWYRIGHSKHFPAFSLFLRVLILIWLFLAFEPRAWPGLSQVVVVVVFELPYRLAFCVWYHNPPHIAHRIVLNVSLTHIFNLPAALFIVWFVRFSQFSIIYFNRSHINGLDERSIWFHHSYGLPPYSFSFSSMSCSLRLFRDLSMTWSGHSSFLSLAACMIVFPTLISCWFLNVLADSRICYWVGSSCNWWKSMRNLGIFSSELLSEMWQLVTGSVETHHRMTALVPCSYSLSL